MARHSKQKREQNAPIQTLHNFFNPKPLLSQSTRGKSTRPVKAQELIVVDSDSEDERNSIQACNNKRRKLNPDNVESPTIPLVKDSERLSPTRQHSKENPTTIAQQASSSKSVPKSFFLDEAYQENSSCFGNPFLLLNDSLDRPIEEPISSSFGKPILLTSFKNMPNLSESEIDLRIPYPPSVPALPSEEPKVDIDLTENWEDGDDERLIESKLEDEEDDSDIEFVSSEDIDTKKAANVNAQRFGEGTSGTLGIDKIPYTSKSDLLMTKFSSTGSVGPPKSLAISSSSTYIRRDDKEPVQNAFSFIMSSLKETEIWKETVSKDKMSGPQKAQGNRRKAPFYKILQGMPIAVDAFNYGKIPGVAAYFLTHAHSDHYTNLSSTWKNGPIYCSQGTANLIIHKLSVDKEWVHPLPMDTPTIIPNTNGVAVTLIEANHCPGSCLFCFEGLQTVDAGDSTFKSTYVGSSRVFRYLHCGDFRASPNHILHPAVKGKVIDHVYLDTTYLDPKYTFPPQPLVISACAELARRIVSGENRTRQDKSTVLSWVQSSESKGKGREQERGRSLVVIGTYSIGKERIAKAIAQALNTKIYCDARKNAILKCQDDPELHALLASDPQEGFVHLVPLGSIATDRLRSYLDGFGGYYSQVIGFRPTGWTYTQAAGTNQSPSIQGILSASSKQNYTFADLVPSPTSVTNLSIYPVPYSEHSSFYELTCFAMSFNWSKMIATVNVGSEKSRGKMNKWIAKWEAERKKRGRETIVPFSSPDYWG